MEIRKGDIWLVDLNGRVGSEQGGIRPCLIVQNNIGNSVSSTTIVCPITKAVKNYTLTHVDVQLLHPSTILCEQITVIDKARLKRKIDSVTLDTMALVAEKIKIVLDM